MGTSRGKRAGVATRIALSTAFAIAGLAGSAFAQTTPPPTKTPSTGVVKTPAKPAPRTTAPAAAATTGTAGAIAPAQGQQPSKNDVSWVKLCEKAPQMENKEVCLTHHERVDGNTGMPLVSAAIRKIEGQDKQALLVTIPTAIALSVPPGVQAKIDENEPIALKYTFCYAVSCQAEAEATPEMIEKLKKGNQLVVAAMNMQRKAVGFPVPLGGFGKAYDGQPIDSKKYAEARKQLMETIRSRQTELAKKAAEAETAKADAAGAGAAPAKPARPPAPKATN